MQLEQAQRTADAARERLLQEARELATAVESRPLDPERHLALGRFYLKTVREWYQAEEETEASYQMPTDDGYDEYFIRAVKLAQGQRQLSTSFLQTRLRIGYPRAARLREDLENEGVLGPGGEVINVDENELLRNVILAGQKLTVTLRLIRRRYPAEWTRDSLLLQAADSYLKAIAIGFRDKEPGALARIEYAELGRVETVEVERKHSSQMGRSFSWMGIDWMIPGTTEGARDSLRQKPSGAYYAREAEQMLRQLLKKPPDETRHLQWLRLLQRAVEAQGDNAWDIDGPRGWDKKMDAIKARIAELETRLSLRGQVASQDLTPPPALASPIPQHSHHIGEEDAYGPDWPELARQIRERDGYRCTECGTGDEELHVHHITPLSAGGTNDPENLITLCRACHSNVHPHMTD